MITFADIRNSFLLEDVMRKHGVSLKGRSTKWGICPMPFHQHKNNTPSMSLYWTDINGSQAQVFYCHGNCGARGDVIDFVGFMNIPGYISNLDMRKQAASYIMADYQPSFFTAPEKKPIISQWIWESFLPISDVGRLYLNNRGVSDEVIDEWKIGSCTIVDDGIPIKNGNEKLISIPIFELHSLIGIKLRSISGDRQYRYFSYPGSRNGLFGYDFVDGVEDPIIMTKGEIATLVLVTNGFKSCAPAGGEGSNVEQYASLFYKSKHLIYIGDNDKPGKKLSPKRAEAIGATLFYPPEQYKDVDEWISKDSNAVKTIQKLTEAKDVPDKI